MKKETNRTLMGDYISKATICYRHPDVYSEFTEQHAREVEEMKDAYLKWKEAGFPAGTEVEITAYNLKMFVFQNPSIHTIIDEVKELPQYNDYLNGKVKLKGFLIGQIMHKYPYCDIEVVKQLL